MATLSLHSLKPDYSLERELGGIVCGIDEAGRGPLAGPVVASAVILNPEKMPDGITDSKTLDGKRRESLFRQLTTYATCGVGIASVEEIDSLNILQASLLAMSRAVKELPKDITCALIDGNQKPELPCDMHCIVKGDSRCLSIGAASIIAKVTRDRLMHRYATQYPGYGFERHMGYSTQQHMNALKELGVTPIHRRSFAPVQKCLHVNPVA